MRRQDSLHQIQEHHEWDLLVIGGGASGLGVAFEAVSRGYRTLLVEQHDFSKGTSSRSTKLIHGGVRYLRQGNITLVRDALRERGRLVRNAPRLVHDLAFVVPVYRWRDLAFYGAGLKFYDLLAGRLSLGRSRILSRSETIERLPTIRQPGLKGGVLYHDAQFDDSRLAVSLARGVTELGGTVANYVRVIRLLKPGRNGAGAVIKDVLSGAIHEVTAREIVNATGAFADEIRRLDDPNSPRVLTTSQGAHLVLNSSFWPARTALMVPKTEDGRVLFAIPWHNRVLIGTTDVPLEEVALEPVPLAEEVDFLLRHAGLYLEKAPRVSDILSVFAGIRPLVTGKQGPTSALSRDHQILVSDSGLVSLVGGKWTTYRKMGEDTVNAVERTGKVGRRRSSGTGTLPIEGAVESGDGEVPGPLLHPLLPYTHSDVNRAVREEMACTVEDVLARRTRALFLDARAAMEMAPVVAAIMAKELGCGDDWQREQVKSFLEVAKNYLPEDVTR